MKSLLQLLRQEERAVAAIEILSNQDNPLAQRQLEKETQALKGLWREIRQLLGGPDLSQPILEQEGRIQGAVAGSGAGIGDSFSAVSRAVDDVFKPGVVKLSCGCSRERAAQCHQKGVYKERGHPEVENQQCHIFMHEDDLLDLTFEVIRARFLSAGNAESNPSKEAVVRFLYSAEAGLTKLEKNILEKAAVILNEL